MIEVNLRASRTLPFLSKAKGDLSLIIEEIRYRRTGEFKTFTIFKTGELRRAKTSDNAGGIRVFNNDFRKLSACA